MTSPVSSSSTRIWQQRPQPSHKDSHSASLSASSGFSRQKLTASASAQERVLAALEQQRDDEVLVALQPAAPLACSAHLSRRSAPRAVGGACGGARQGSGVRLTYLALEARASPSCGRSRHVAFFRPDAHRAKPCAMATKLATKKAQWASGGSVSARRCRERTRGTLA